MPVLVLLHLLVNVLLVSASEIDIKDIVKQVEEASHQEKEEVKQLISHVKEKSTHLAQANQDKVSQENCSAVGCNVLKETSKGMQKDSPLLDANKPLIFVSSSMPIESLKRLAYQAVQHGAILVIRGMVKNSMLETAKLVDQIDHPLEIDPKLFAQFEIQKVPVFLINHATSWHKVSGNVELNFALEHCSKPLLVQQEKVQS